MGGKNYKAVSHILFGLLFLLAACKKDKPVDVPRPPAGDSTDKVYVVSEGSLGNGNSSLDMYDPKTAVAYRDVYKSANNADLGDVFQSMQVIGDRMFLSVNNSDKIVVLNKDHTQVGVINVSKPRYILSISDDKAYVSSLYSNKVHIINPKSMQLTGTIILPAKNPEGMLLYNGKAYITAWDTASDKIFVVNTSTDQIEQEIAVAGRASQGIALDKNNKLWVLSGNVPKGKTAALTQIDPATMQVVRAFHFPEKADPIKPVFNRERDMLYFIEVNYKGGTDYNGIYRISIDADKLPEQPFIKAQQFQYFWALGIQPDNNHIFVGDPKGFTQKGIVYIYDTDGNKKGDFETGVGPGHFYFYKK
jgi:DNA-binding beta-propeller fold protein YncE